MTADGIQSVHVKCNPSGGIGTSISGFGLKLKTNGGIDIDTVRLYVVLNTSRGIGTTTPGLNIKDNFHNCHGKISSES